MGVGDVAFASREWSCAATETGSLATGTVALGPALRPASAGSKSVTRGRGKLDAYGMDFTRGLTKQLFKITLSWKTNVSSNSCCVVASLVKK